MVIYCDNADRLIADVDAGINGVNAWARLSTAPAEKKKEKKKGSGLGDLEEGKNNNMD